MTSAITGTAVLASVFALAGCADPDPAPSGAGIGSVETLAPDEPVEPDPASGVQVAFEPCERTAVDLSTTNLRPSQLTAEDRALAGDLAELIPDGTLVVEHATELPLEDGRLAFGNAYEAGTASAPEGFQKVAPGQVTAQVAMLVLNSPSRGRVVAFVEVRLSPELPVRWEEFPQLGFVTDGGDGGVVASQAPPLGPEDPNETGYLDAFFPDGSSVPEVCVVRRADREADAVLFSAGYGDGLYPTYAGYDAEGDIVSLVSHNFVVPWILSGLPGTAPEIPGEPSPT